MTARTVFITGASSGIGAASARLFAERGWNVAATMRSPEKAPDLGSPERIALIRLDVTDATSIRESIEATLSRFGAVDVVVNNAGFAAVGPFEASTSEEVTRQFATNVFGLMDVTRAWLPHLRERKAGVIVNVASVGGRVAFPLYSLYHATKWAVEGFTESLRYELEPLGLRVKIVEPGPIKTDFYDRSAQPMSRPGLTAYDAFVAKVMPKLEAAGHGGATPESVARVIFRASTDGNRRLRYSANSAAILAMRRLLPDSLFAALVRRVFG
jgi:short-subunit dehydrogenase